MATAKQTKQRILVTGGTGFIGSHTCIELIKNNYEVTILDNLVNAKVKVLDRIKEITGVKPEFAQLDLCDFSSLNEWFGKASQKQPFDAVIHVAGLKAVGESVANPLRYYENNLLGTLNLLKSMQNHNCFNLVFSSSATVYGSSQNVPFKEEEPVSATNPYGSTKLFIERMLFDLVASDAVKSKTASSTTTSSSSSEEKTVSAGKKRKSSAVDEGSSAGSSNGKGGSSDATPHWRIAILRYFNPIGAHESGLIGEDPNGVPNNLVPYLTQVAVGKLPHLNVYGSDYDTPDGTGVRDYIHVVDLSLGHLAALSNGIFGDGMKTNCEVYNLGSGQGNSVMQLISAMEKACGKTIPYKVVARRAGDVAKSYADPSKAKTDLKWSTKFSLQEAMNDAWRWQKMNPKGLS